MKMTSPVYIKTLQKITVFSFLALLSCQGNTTQSTTPAPPDSTVRSINPPTVKKEKTYLIQEEEISKAVYEASRSSYQDLTTYDSLAHASKDGKIVLPVKNGAVTFTDNTGVPHDENITTHKYIGQIKAIHKYVIEVHLYEDSHYLLIDSENGKEDMIAGPPYLSPDHLKIFSSQFNPYETYDHMAPPTQDVEFFTVSENGMKEIARKPFGWYFNELYWKDNQTLYIKATKTVDGTDFIFKKLVLTEH